MVRRASAQRVVDRWMVRRLVRNICATTSFQSRSASLRDLTPDVMTAFVEAFTLPLRRSGVRVAFLKGLGGKIKRLWGLFKRAPQLWDKIKEYLGIEGLADIPAKLKEWAKKGLEFLRKGLSSLLRSNPFTAMYVIPKAKMPGLTDMLARIREAHPKIAAVWDKFRGKLKSFDEWMAEHPYFRSAARPLLAAAFIWIWFHVSELSWDLESLVKGFTGSISVGELVGSLPESSIGLLVSLLIPGLGTFALLAPTAMARVGYLLYRKIILWMKGKGFIVDWEKLGVEGGGRELVPVL